MTSYHFSLGDSSKGPIGFCARVHADSEEEAAEKLRDALNSINNISAVDVDDCDIDYVEVYFNSDSIDESDIDEENGE